MTCMIGTTMLAVAVSTTASVVTFPLKRIQTEEQCKQSMAYYNKPKFKRTENIGGSDFLIPHHFCVPCNGWQKYRQWYLNHRLKVARYAKTSLRPFMPTYTRKQALIALMGAAATTDDRTGKFEELGRFDQKNLPAGMRSFFNANRP